MSRFLTKEGDKYIEEIESMEVYRWLVNEVCCNNGCEYIADYPDIGCDNKEECEYFEKEDGIIEVIE